uniref:Uncharacterized protein n=1 Tax=Candidatus Kentrum sp. FM TaxID=2126340 RepID=A0A450SI17_9GAMM|nr:MAG: conserved hypothetical protein [Candidatus Kentron sp. FM]VFJ53812.1 MAG: conserved hypothetical protein [Candidatus Kentron sp. FM]VFK15091.1 MAG: conserved hypothetical protein [Candidatus Kentron sp. FM]
MNRYLRYRLCRGCSGRLSEQSYATHSAGFLKKIIVAGCVFGSGLSIVHGHSEHAHDEPIHEFTGNVVLTSDYLFRGYSQTDEDPAIQGSLDYKHTPSGIYLGAWASNIEFNTADNTDDSSIEIDFYGGISGELTSGISWDIGGLYYCYPDQNEDSGVGDYDYFEVYAGLGYTFEDTVLSPGVGVMLFYSNDYFGEDEDAYYPAGTLDLALPWEFGLGFSVGYLHVDGDETNPAGYDYTHWSVGLSREIAGFGVDVSYNDASDDDACPSDFCEAVVFSVSRGF